MKSLFQSRTGTLLTLLILACLVVGCAQTSMLPSSTSGTERIVGDPTLSSGYIDRILTDAHSPAQELGTTLYQLSIQYHIDDAFALAFFHHESNYGKSGVAAITHSLGNIRCTAGYTCDPTGGYRSYPTWADGATDWYQLISTVYISNGLDTVSQIIPVYAPTDDNNNESAYIHSVLQDVANYRTGGAR